jgi:hypothetical protein
VTTLKDLSPQVKRALVLFQDRMGASLPRGLDSSVVVELRQLALVSPRMNLTGLGESLRRQVVDEMLEAL